MVQGFSGERRLLVRFQYGCERDMTLDQTTIITVEKIPVNEEPEVPSIDVIPDNTVYLENLFYHGIYVMQHFMK